MAKKKRTKQKGRGFSGLLLLVMVTILFVAALPTFILLAVGLLPSVVAYIIDTTPGKYAARCVFGLNFSGVAPYAMALWTGAQDLTAVMEIITDPFAITVMLGAAALGWLIHMAMPPVVASFLNMAAQRRIKELRESQQKLVDAWGSELIDEIDKT